MRLAKNKRNFLKGFSIGEVILSAFILAFTLVVLIRVLSISLRDSMDSRDSIIASDLAQEGVELIRNIRDNNWVALGQGLTSFTASPGLPAINKSNCIITMGRLYAYCPPTGNPDYRLYYTNICYPSGNCYYYSDNIGGSASSPSKFQRKLSFTYNPAGSAASNADTLTVNSMVVWNRSDGDFPANNASCTIGSKCVFTEITLNKWNE